MGDITHVNSGNARSKDQADELKRIAESKFCPFCSEEYMTTNHPHPIEISTPLWYATKNRWQYDNSGFHYVIIMRRHVANIDEVSPEEWSALKTVVSDLEKKHHLKGATLFMRHGDTRYTGGSVTHLHAQLVSGSGDAEKAVVARLG